MVIKALLLQKLWDGYIGSIPKFYQFFKAGKPYVDHFAIIDLPSTNSGIPYLYKIFNKLGFVKRGEGYLNDKQNDFVWLGLHDIEKSLATQAFPQIVIADFRLEKLSLKVRKLIHKYTSHTESIDFKYLEMKLKETNKNIQALEIATYIYNHLSKRQYDIPSLKDFLTIQEENQLIAWTLIFNRKVNHFGININLLNQFSNLQNFNNYLKSYHNINFNMQGGEIKGDAEIGISQSATIGQKVKVKLLDGEVSLNDSFMEFVWRHSKVIDPQYFNDFYSHFLPANANYIVESLWHG